MVDRSPLAYRFLMRDPRSPRRQTSCALASLLVLFSALPLTAQEPPTALPSGTDPTHETTAPRARAFRTDQPISIDGRLDEEIWRTAEPVTAFRQIDPDEGAPASQRTEVRIAYDRDALYIGATLRDDGRVSTKLARRDAGLGGSDVFAVELDSYHDHQTAARFSTTPSGMKRDGLISSSGLDLSWDPVWDVATAVGDDGWVVEMRIPFSQLRFRPDSVQTWGIQIERQIDRLQEQSFFAFTPKLEQAGVQRFGHLVGIEGIRPGRRLELLPYTTARAEYLKVAEPPGIPFADPFRSGAATFAGTGLDLKFRLSSNVTLDGTVNPDFGQVEVDPAVINLTAFETRFDEKRPFFIEGAEIFRFGEGGPGGSTGRAPEFLYSRRIGRAPQGVLPGNVVYDETPMSTTILGAAKLTGKIGDGWSVGLLEAVTAREVARTADAFGTLDEITVEPRTNYLIGRLRRDVHGGRTRFGAAFTAIHRDLDEPALLARLHDAAYSAGVDFRHEWDGRMWRFSSSFSPSLVTGEADAVARTQRSSTRYLNRPDASHLTYDPSATRLTGYYAMTEINKQAGTFTGRLALGAASPGYEVNDAGFQTYADRLVIDTHFQYNQLRPGRFLRSWFVGGGPDNVWNYAGRRVLANTNVVGRFQATNYWSGSWRLEYIPETDDDRLTRGGPVSRVPRAYGGNFGLNSDPRKRHTVGGQVAYSTDAAGSWARSATLTGGLRPRENWEIQVGPNLTRRYAAAQYVRTVADSRATGTYGQRYLFAGLDQTTFGIDTRVNVTFSPTLSFQMYAQPFLSAGDYDGLKELRTPGVFDFVVYGEDAGTIDRRTDGTYRVDPTGDDPTRGFTVQDPDFTLRSLLGNAVLRWEWRAGSTLYLVWQQRRTERLTGGTGISGDDTIGRLTLGRDAGELLGIRPDNIFAIKVNYWLNP